MEIKYFGAALVGAVVACVVVALETRWVEKRVIGFTPDFYRYVIAAAAMATIYVLLLFQYGFEVITLGYALLIALLCAETLTDIDTARIPSGLIVFGVVVWLCTVWFVTVPGNDFGIGAPFVSLFGNGFFSVFLDSALAAATVGGVTLVFSVVYEQVTGRPSLGGGDIKLLFVIALFVGLSASIINLLLACVFGLIFSMIWHATKKYRSGSSIAEISMSPLSVSAQSKATQAASSSKRASTTPRHYTETNEPIPDITKRIEDVKTFPFGPAIAAATVVVLLVAPTVLG